MYAVVSAFLGKGWKKVGTNFLRQLPGLNIWENYKMVQVIKGHERLIAFYSTQAELAKKKKLKEKFEAMAWAYSQKLDKIKSQHQIFKGYQAVFESGLQFILQFTIAFGMHDSLEKIELWVWLTTIISFISMASTFTSLFVELPFQVGDKVYTPQRTLSQYLKILVLMTLSLAFRLYPIVLILVYFQWGVIIIGIPMFLLINFVLSVVSLVVASKGRQKMVSSEMKEESVLAVFTSPLQPCVQIFYTGDGNDSLWRNFIFLCNQPYIYLMLSLCIMINQGWFVGCYKYNFSNEDKVQSETYFWIGFGLVFFQAFLFESMRVTTTSNNNVYTIQEAADLNSTYMLHYVTRIPPVYQCNNNPGSTGINDIIPQNGLTSISYTASKRFSEGIEELLSPFRNKDWKERNEVHDGAFSYYYSKILCLNTFKKYTDRKLEPNLTGSLMSNRNEEMTLKIAKMEQTARTLHEMSETNEATNVMNKAKKLWNEMIDSDPYYSKSALMISSELKDIDSLKIFMEKGKENKVDFNLQDHELRSAFIFACQESGDLEKRKETCEIFIQYAEVLEIDLQLKDKNDKTGFDYLPQDLINELKEVEPLKHNSLIFA